MDPKGKWFYKVMLAENKFVTMYCSEYTLPDSDDYPVLVYSDAFVKIWDAEQYNYAPPEKWIHDKKFPDADNAFKNSECWPVRLAEIGMVYHPISGKLRLVNGVTRTLWLLTHGAKYFPILCPKRDISNLIKETWYC
ncbi:MAG: hypothetical protein IJD04_03305 [Desulfovibrionaceae bacterium]|nr:hypothetical protein [Desulfovibrionaceae bacterium]